MTGIDIDNYVPSRVAIYNYNDFLGLSEEYDALVDYLGYVDDSKVLGFNRSEKKDRTICTHPYVLLNQTECDFYECTWLTEEITPDMGQKSIISSMFSIMVNMFTFSYDFGVDNATLETILYIIFILLPLLLLIITSVYAIFG
jgi:hypothetical protein